MAKGLRTSMTWLHTWAGVVLGALLFAIFWMGTLSVFDRQIDRWMMPETRIVLDPAYIMSLDDLSTDVPKLIGHDVEFWWLNFPEPRSPVAGLWSQDPEGAYHGVLLNPVTGERLPERQTLGGSGFIFPFHFNLHLKWFDIGYWLVGLAGMAMLVLLVSGVIIHRKIFADFFTFRRERKLPRSSLDLHNLTGVIGLPFHFVITLSGLIIFTYIYFPSTPSLVYAEANDPYQALLDETQDLYSRPALSEGADLASLDAMVREANVRWNGAGIRSVQVHHPGDANSYVRINRGNLDFIPRHLGVIYFDGPTGAVLHTAEMPKPVKSVERFIVGLHFIQFEHWTLRWIYFVLGLSGCVMIATGYIYWLETRRKRHAAQGLAGVRVVEGLTVGAVSGIIIATLAFFVANRLLPLGASFAGQDREALEIWAFYLVWLATFVHAWARPDAAWREQCWVIAALAVLAPALNWATTGDHPIKTVFDGYWPVAGMDLLLLFGAAVAAMTAWRLHRRSAWGASRTGPNALKAAE